MASPLHSKQTVTDGIHGAVAFEYANAAARLAATGFVAEDINKIARQLDDNSLWILVSISPITWSSVATGAVPTSRQIIAGAGLTGGGDLSADRTLDVVANADGSVVVNANDIQVGILATDTQHGIRGGGTQHAVATTVVAGFMSATDKTRFDTVIEAKDEGVSIGTGKSKINFTGAGVLATIDGGDPSQINVTIPGSGTATIMVKDEGAALTPDKNKLNFVGPGITATTDGGDTSQANITISVAIAGTINVGDAASAGTADSLSRSDHVHALPAPGAPVDVTKAAASAGVSTTVARADHKHDISTAASGTIQPDDTAAEGTATSLARSDHRHAIAAAAPGAINVGDAAAEGASTSFARADHVHSLAAPASPANVNKSAASAGASANVARQDHKHDIDTATVVNVGDANAEGTATSLARSDHVHKEAHPILLWGNDSVAATTTTRYLTPGFTSALAPTSAIQFRVPSSGTIRRLRVRHNTTAGNGNSIVYTVRINGTASAVTVSLASTANDGSDLTNTAAIAAGDLLDIEVTKAASVGTSPSDIIATLEVIP